MTTARRSFLSGLERVLILAAHTDDEFGCAGLIQRLRDEGAGIRYIAMSPCKESVPAGFPDDVLVHECRACLAVLGVPDDQVEIWDLPVRHFPRLRQDILERLVRIGRSWSPDLVILPSSHDTHQDHETVSREGFRAFKRASIWGYELPQNLVRFENSAFVALTEAQLDGKIRALSCYRSQGDRPYSGEDFIRGLARVRGIQAGVDHAEAFEVIRLIV